MYFKASSKDYFQESVKMNKIQNNNENLHVL